MVVFLIINISKNVYSILHSAETLLTFHVSSQFVLKGSLKSVLLPLWPPDVCLMATAIKSLYVSSVSSLNDGTQGSRGNESWLPLIERFITSSLQ